jgi:Ca2+-binding RTX toxin-like protein
MVATATSVIGKNYLCNPFAKLTGTFAEANAWEWVAFNSNSFINSILYHDGFDPENNQPTNVAAFTPGLQTLLDTTGAHTLSAAGYFSDIFAGDGNDVVNGDADPNCLFGGSGNDRINGGGGDDTLSGVLFELATDGPGFATDEALDALGTTLSLPPFLEGRRRVIEAGLKPL